jgi:PAS domain-containing protein
MPSYVFHFYKICFQSQNLTAKSSTFRACLQMSIDWDRVPSSIMVCEQDGRIKLVNACFTQKIMDVPNLTSLLLWDIVRDDDVAKVRSALATAAQDGGLQGVVFELLLLQRNGFPCLTECEAHVQADGHELVLSILLSPLKKQAAIATQVKQAVDFLVLAPAPLQLVSPSGHILWANEALLTQLEYTPQEYIGKHVQEFTAAVQSGQRSKALASQPKQALQHSSDLSDLMRANKTGKTVAIPVDATLHVDRGSGQHDSTR